MYSKLNSAKPLNSATDVSGEETEKGKNSSQTQVIVISVGVFNSFDTQNFHCLHSHRDSGSVCSSMWHSTPESGDILPPQEKIKTENQHWSAASQSFCV